MKRLSILIILFFSFNLLSAQEFIVPKNYSFTYPEDYKKYESEIAKCIDYLYQLPLDSQIVKRKEASAFFINWIYGTPDVSVVIYKDVIPFITDQTLFEIFLCGYVKKVFELQDDKQLRACYQEGIIYVINYYEKNRSNLKYRGSVKKYARMHKNGKLEGFLRKHIQ